MSQQVTMSFSVVPQAKTKDVYSVVDKAIEEEVADSNRIISSNEKNSTSKDTHIENESTTEKAVLKDEYEDLDTANLFGN